jgi:uncharacterized membrane protein YfcA
MRLAAIGTAAGFFSGLFGVGGGTVIVPLLVLWLAYDERTATGTSLVAIAVTAALGAALQGLYGNLDVGRAALVALPGLGGVVAGTALQQRIGGRAISALFGLLLAGVAVDLLVR